MIAVKKPDILVVDDEPGITATLAMILEGSGYTVVTAATGGAALNAVAGVAFDTALVDLHLPDSDGISLAREICKRLPRCRILLVTGSIELSELQTARNGGLEFDILPKPVAPEELLKRLAEMLQGGRKAATGKAD